MPEGYTHVRTARKAAHAIHYKVRCPEAFAAGANGPDVFFSFEIWKRPRSRRFDLPALGSRMHEEATGAFLQSLLRHVKTGAQVEYTLGFLSHYAADTLLHPYVAAVCEPGGPYAGKGGHGYFEIALDSTLHAEDTGVSQVPADDVCPLPKGEDLAEITLLLQQALRETYGAEVSAECLADAFYYFNRVRRLFTSRHGLRRGLFYVVETFFGGRGFLTGHVSPRALALNLPDDWTDPATGQQHHGGAFALLKQAERLSALYMTGALQHWMGVLPQTDMVKLLGSRDYGTGTETERSTAPAVGPAAQQPDAAGPTEPQPYTAKGD